MIKIKMQGHNTHNNINHYIIMFIIMILSGLLSTMNVYVDKFSDISFSLNDIYMILLMNGWMFIFMSIYNKNLKFFILGLILVVFNLFAIRTQFMITKTQYIRGMIPHHSMAITMSKKLLEKDTTISNFLENIINTQSKEIEIMKNEIQ